MPWPDKKTFLPTYLPPLDTCDLSPISTIFPPYILSNDTLPLKLCKFNSRGVWWHGLSKCLAQSVLDLICFQFFWNFCGKSSHKCHHFMCVCPVSFFSKWPTISIWKVKLTKYSLQICLIWNNTRIHIKFIFPIFYWAWHIVQCLGSNSYLIKWLKWLLKKIYEAGNPSVKCIWGLRQSALSPQ